MILVIKLFICLLIILLPLNSSITQEKKDIKSDSIKVNDTESKNYNYNEIIINNYKTHGHQPELIGRKAPSFTFPSYTGQKVSLSQFKGKILLLDFWESWCGKCISSFPEINRLSIEYKDKGVEVLGITTENKNMVKKLINKNKLLYHNICADNTITRKYKVSSRPTYILISKEGKIIFVSNGNLKIIEDKIKQIVNGKTGKNL